MNLSGPTRPLARRALRFVARKYGYVMLVHELLREGWSILECLFEKAAPWVNPSLLYMAERLEAGSYI